MNELRADSIIHSFGNKRILSDIFLSLKTDEIVGLLGRNGCGKSTLLRILFGTLNPDQGVIHIDNRYYKHIFSDKQAAYLPQHSFVPANLTVSEAFSLFSEQAEQDKTIEYHKHIHSLQYKRIHELSGGELRLLEISLILTLPRPFMFLDEPFTGLSPLYRDEVHSWLATAKKNKGIILTDHDYRNIIDISDRLMLLKNGRLIPVENPAELVHYNYLP